MVRYYFTVHMPNHSLILSVFITSRLSAPSTWCLYVHKKRAMLRARRLSRVGSIKVSLVKGQRETADVIDMLWMGFESFFIIHEIWPFECKTRGSARRWTGTVRLIEARPGGWVRDNSTATPVRLCHKELVTWWGVRGAAYYWNSLQS